MQVSDGTTTFVYDFETLNLSTATIAAGAVTATGGTVSVTLNASPDAVGPTVFTIGFSGSTAVCPAPVTLAAGQSTTVEFPLPFGTTNVAVQAQVVTIASAPITFDITVPPPPPTTAPPTTSAPAGTIPATGAPSGNGPMLAFGLSVC